MLSGEADLSGDKGVVNHGCFAVKRQPGLGFLMTGALESPHKIQMPGGAAKLTVGDHMVPSLEITREFACKTDRL